MNGVRLELEIENSLELKREKIEVQGRKVNIVIDVLVELSSEFSKISEVKFIEKGAEIRRLELLTIEEVCFEERLILEFGFGIKEAKRNHGSGIEGKEEQETKAIEDLETTIQCHIELLPECSFAWVDDIIVEIESNSSLA